MWGGTLTRNMVLDEPGLPTEWDVRTGANVKWVAALGSTSYGNPVVVGARSLSVRTTTDPAIQKSSATEES